MLIFRKSEKILKKKNLKRPESSPEMVELASLTDMKLEQFMLKKY